MRWCRWLLLLAGAVLVSPRLAGAQLVSPVDPLEFWDVTYPTPPRLGQVVAGNEVFVGLPFSGTGAPLISTDGVEWSRIPIRFGSFAAGFTGVAFGSGAFFGVTGAGEVFRSSNGLDWTSLSYSPVTPEGETDLNFIAAGNGSIVVLNRDGLVSVSSDGMVWTWPEWLDAEPRRLTYGNGVFLALISRPDELESVVLESVDGLNWIPKVPVPDETLVDLSFSDGLFSALTSMGTLIISANGFDWAVQGRFPETGGIPLAIVHGAGRFVGLIEHGEDQNSALVSLGGAQWTTYPGLIGAAQVVFGLGKFLAYGINQYISSDGGNVWINEPRDSGGLPTSVAFGKGRFVAVGGSAVLVSTNGGKWAQLTLPSGTRVPAGIYFANNKFVGPSWPSYDSAGFPDQGYVLTSGDGLTWSEHSGPPSLSSLRSIVFGNGLFVAIGDGNALYSSSDGVTWTKRAETLFLTRVLFGNGLFVASPVYNSPANEPPPESAPVYTSPDGITWTEQTANFPVTLMTFGNGIFLAEMAASFTRHILSSSDGVNWTVRYRAPNQGFNSTSYAAFGGGLFVLVTPFHVLSSPDGIVWADRLVNAPLPVAQETIHPALAYGQHTFVTVLKGYIQQSAPVPPPFVVEVRADPALASEIGPVNGRFHFTRSGVASMDIDVKVKFHLGGTAQNGLDYLPILYSAVIPAGKTSVSIAITPISNPLAPGSKNVVLTLLPGDGYDVGSLSSATIQIEPQGFPGHIGSSGITWSADGSVRLAIASAPGASLLLEASTDLQNWHPITTLVSPTGLLQFIDWTTNMDRRFYRTRPFGGQAPLGAGLEAPGSPAQ